MAQSVERHLGKVEVTGSIPVNSLVKPLRNQGFFFFYPYIRNFSIHDISLMAINNVLQNLFLKQADKNENIDTELLEKKKDLSIEL